MESFLIDKIVDVIAFLNQQDQEKVLGHAKKKLAARRIEGAYAPDIIPFEISYEEIEKEIKMNKLLSKI